MRKIWTASLVLILTALLLAGCSTAASTSAPAAATSAPAAPAATTPPPAASIPTVAAPAAASAGSTSAVDAKALLEDRCTRCHSLNKVSSHKGSADEWTRVVESMIQKGAVLSADEKTALIQYLAATYK